MTHKCFVGGFFTDKHHHQSYISWRVTDRRRVGDWIVCAWLPRS